MKEIQKNKREVIRISDGEYKPTKKGISFNPFLAKEVIEGILEIVEWNQFDNK